LKELRDELETVDPACVYYHFWGGLLRPTFDDPRYNNDFARWVASALHNLALAERLSVIDPTDFADLDGLREATVDVIEDEMDNSPPLPWTDLAQCFHFVRSQIVVFHTGRTVDDPGQLPEAVEAMSRSSIFYHFVDARRRTPNSVDDFSTWLTDLDNVGYAELCTRLKGIDPFFKTLGETRDELLAVFRAALGGDTA
jgi:hypothetical protein